MRHSLAMLDGPAAACTAGRYEQPVPRGLVHRASVSEVFLTNLHQDRADAFVLSAQWPRGHSYYRSRAGLHDPLLFAETTRQAGLLIGHSGYQVPLGDQFILNGLDFDIADAGLACGSTPTDLLLQARCDNVQRRGQRLVGLDLQVALYRDLEWVGQARCRFSCVSPAVYRRLRGEVSHRPAPDAASLPPVDPAAVGRDSAADVVLSPGSRPDTWLLRCDRSHPVLFDHPVDHVPGMVVLEAMRQASLVLTADPTAVPLSCRTDFLRFAELDRPAEVTGRIEARSPDGTTSVRVVLAQDGDIVAESVLWFRDGAGS
ncbi:ScbA/BarX family gamma-butyrolactone biosynthesis protein [Streptacidiphilus rugosus]|uniref:ScbA/BarX family gamma-butyrolactone biosynthesis protein n=1 Tax=Streptacidiphilus rugosus TaxID=405783 RepID=UPI0018DB2D32|nr:ScbA/BarX family gamma-butyrolactone biosynthesis protein [Streptacidiphilus rugosus]